MSWFTGLILTIWLIWWGIHYLESSEQLEKEKREEKERLMELIKEMKSEIEELRNDLDNVKSKNRYNHIEY